VSLSYTHTLIPDQAGYTPHPNRVRDFVRALGQLGAIPIKPILQVVSDAERISWLEGKPIIVPVGLDEGRRLATKSLPRREGRNPVTGEIIFVPRRDCTLLPDIEDLPLVLEGLDQYEFEVSGAGPLKLAWFDFNPDSVPCESPFEFLLRCCLSREIVSTSDYHGDQPTSPEIKPFGRPIAADETNGIGFFSNPATLETINVPAAGCSRFWIELVFGKATFPKIEGSLNLLHPSVVAASNKAFGVNFAQGCWWG
jgi:cellulase/cellobiase CelA1